MDLRFLDNREAALELENSGYLRKMSHNELLVRLAPFYRFQFGRTDSQGRIETYTKSELKGALTSVYVKSYQNFDDIEIAALKLYFSKISDILKSIGITTDTGLTIGLIKISDHHGKIDWGYLYTLGNSIVIPTGYLKSLVNGYRQYNLFAADIGAPSSAGLPVQTNDNILLRQMGDLYHEVLHIFQRMEQNKNKGQSQFPSHFFEKMYGQFLGFERIDKSQILGRKRLRRELVTITNPDAANFEYIITMMIGGKYQTVVPTLVFNPDTGRPEDVLFSLQPLSSSQFPEGTRASRPRYLLDGKYHKLSDKEVCGDNLSRVYRSRFFGLTRQLHHPNEISAQLLSDYMILGKLWGNDLKAFPLYKYINDALGIETLARLSH